MARPLQLIAVIIGSVEIVLFAGVIFGWHSIVYIYKDEGYFDVCHSDNDTQITPAPGNLSVALWVSNNSEVSTFSSPRDEPTCEERFRNRQQQSGSQSICAEQDNNFNLIFTLSTVINGFMGIINGYFYDRFGTRFCRILSIVCYLCGLSFNIAASSENPYLLFPAFILTTYGGYLILITNLQLAGLIPRLRSMLMSLYAGSYDTSSGIFLLFKVLHENGLKVNFCFVIQGCLFSMIIVSTFLIHKKTHLPWPLSPDYVLKINKCGKQKHVAHGEENNTKSDQKWSINDNGSMVNLQPPLTMTNVADSSGEKLDKYGIIKEEQDRESEKNTESLLQIQNEKPALIKKQDSQNSSELSKVVLSPLFMFDILWMCLQRLRSWFFVGMFNPWITRMACGDKAVVSHYTSFFASIQFMGILTAPMSGRLMDRKISSVHQYSNPKYERLHASIASFLLNITVSVAFSITTAIPVLEVQYVTCILHALHRSFLYGPNSAFVANAFPSEHFGKLFGITLTVSAVFGMLQYPLFLLIQGPLDNDPFAVNILFITLMLISYSHPAYIWYYLRRKKHNQKKAAEETLVINAPS